MNHSSGSLKARDYRNKSVRHRASGCVSVVIGGQPHSNEAVKHTVSYFRDRGHYTGIGNGAPSALAINDTNIRHDKASFPTTPEYEGDGPLSRLPRGNNRHITQDHVETAFGPIIRQLPIKVIARATGRSPEAVKKWRKGTLPEAWASLLSLIAVNEDAYRAMMVTATRDAAALDLRIAQTEAEIKRLKSLRGVAHEKMDRGQNVAPLPPSRQSGERKG